MADLRNTYTFVKKVNKMAQELEDVNDDSVIQDGNYYVGEPSVFSVRQEYRKRKLWPNRSKRKVHLTSGLAVQKGYLKVVKIKGHDQLSYNVYHIQDKGWDLLERSFFRTLPKGLILGWVAKNKDLSTLVIAFIAGIILGIGSLAVAIIGLK